MPVQTATVAQRTHSPPQSSASASTGPTVPPAQGKVVGFGPLAWNTSPKTLRLEVRATASPAWETLPGVFESVKVAIDPSDTMTTLIMFPTAVLAQSFVEAWTKNKNKEGAFKDLQARLLLPEALPGSR